MGFDFDFILEIDCLKLKIVWIMKVEVLLEYWESRKFEKALRYSPDTLSNKFRFNSKTLTFNPLVYQYLRFIFTAGYLNIALILFILYYIFGSRTRHTTNWGQPIYPFFDCLVSE